MKSNHKNVLENSKIIKNIMKIYVPGYHKKSVFDVLDVENHIISRVIPYSKEEDDYSLLVVEEHNKNVLTNSEAIKNLSKIYVSSYRVDL